MIKNKKAQMWSTDVIIATTIFFLAFITIIVLFTRTDTTNDSLVKENELISDALSNKDRDYAFFYDNKIDAEKLSELKTDIDQDYDKIKQELGIANDFCIHFEDEKGNLIVVEDVKVIGSPDAVITLETDGIEIQYYCNGIRKNE